MLKFDIQFIIDELRGIAEEELTNILGSGEGRVDKSAVDKLSAKSSKLYAEVISERITGKITDFQADELLVEIEHQMKAIRALHEIMIAEAQEERFNMIMRVAVRVILSVARRMVMPI